MIERTSLRLFWTMMLLCAACALTGLWFGRVETARLTPTFFIIGFASFLVWAPIMAYRFLEKK